MSNQRPSAAAREIEHDRFSNLFTPSTPRTSPTLLPVIPQISNIFRSRVPKEHLKTDEYGSFVSVSANEDPLSLSLASSNSSRVAPTTFEWDNDVEDELLSTPLLMPKLSSMVPTSSQPSHQPTRTDNASLTFFDKFAQHAKRNSEIRRKGLVDELLKCEDDPLYFLHNGIKRALKKDEQDREDGRESFDSGKEPITSDPELQTSPPSTPPPVLHDLDHDYFSSGHLVPVDINTHNDNNKTPSEQHLSSSFHTRSLSQPSPPTLAPPIMDSISSDLHTLSDELSTKNDINPSSSSSSSSTFSARWSNFLKTSSGTAQQQQGQAATSTLESMRGVNADASSSTLHPPSRTSPPTAASTVSAIHRRNSSSLPIRHHQNPHQQPHASHTLPRSIVIKHTASPFGSHSYIPPSGAPGFRGELYDWDKGFSNELEREIVRGKSGVTENENEDKGRILETEMQAQHTRAGGIGALMEKKTGNLDLKGRKASTSPVLSQNLANLLRPYLPALSRLPRSWTLVYSLDQHGISLNTLYTRCEEALSPSRAIYPSKTGEVGLGTRGVLLIIKDAGGAGEDGDEGVFGAWIADGEGLGMGKKGGKGYFGGGESFLWKFTQGNLRVYRTTGSNNYVALCEPDYISFGGGDGYYGLYLDDTLYDGSSAPCPTFYNEPLCSPGPKKAGTVTVKFECVGLEVWGMGP